MTFHVDARSPLLIRMIPFATIWLWPGLVLSWALSLWLIPDSAAGMFGWTDPRLVDLLAAVMASAAALTIALTLVAPQHRVLVRLVFLVVAGFVFLGRMSTFVVSDSIFAVAGWRSRTIGFVTYALVSTGHVVLTSVAVMIMSNGGSTRARSTR